MYECLRDARFRLDGTVVWYDNKYCYVQSVHEVDDKSYTLDLVSDGEKQLVSLSDPKLKVTSIPTGYVAVAGRACYLKRLPTRAYRQGLRGDNSEVSRVGFRMFRDYVIEGRAEELRKDKILSKDYAVVNGLLFYRGREVGVWINNKAWLSNDKQFLKESLGEVLGNE